MKYNALTSSYNTKVRQLWSNFENLYEKTQDLQERRHLRGEAMSQEYQLEQELKQEVFRKFEVADDQKSNTAWLLAEDHSDSIDEKINFFAKLAFLLK